MQIEVTRIWANLDLAGQVTDYYSILMNLLECIFAREMRKEWIFDNSGSHNVERVYSD